VELTHFEQLDSWQQARRLTKIIYQFVSYILLPKIDILGAGIAYLLSQSIAALIVMTKLLSVKPEVI